MTCRQALMQHRTLYLFEAAELALFMISACTFTVLLFHSSYLLLQLLPSFLVRRILMGVTAILMIHSPMGKRSGAHFNPAITLTYYRLGKIVHWDAIFYILSQFLGGIVGVGVSRLMLGSRLADPSVEYAVTIPGRDGTGAAFAAECFMAALLMGVVLWTSNRPRLAPYTSYCVGVLIAVYIVLFAPISGFSINPARTVGSAVFADIWTGSWLYFIAPLLGMLSAAEVYLRTYGSDRILCAKLHPAPGIPCPFLCRFPSHLYR